MIRLKIIFIGSIALNLILATTAAYWFFQSVIMEKSKDYPLLSPRIFAENQNDIQINFLTLRTNLRQMAADYKDTFAFYFEYLPSGTSIGINEKDELSAASLIKIPVVMTYFRQKENSGLDLDKTIVAMTAKDIDRDYGTLWQRGVGGEVSYEEAVRLTLQESDNTAMLILANRLQPKYFNDVYEGLDIDFVQKDNQTIISAKQYASILKALYFSSVLTKPDSQRILEFLTQTKFKDKLPAGVSENVAVAHKIGVLEKGQLFQDCGIVYIPKRPYILCMFSKSTENEARSRMEKVSRIIFEFVSAINHDD